MVHIRAIPEGGTPAERRARPRDFDAGFPRTFYRRYQAPNEPGFDGRQPLPSVFAASWDGWYDGRRTSFKIWRESPTAGRTCADVEDAELRYTEVVAFDENENAAGNAPPARVPGSFPPNGPLPPASKQLVFDYSFFPYLANGAVRGWMYLNLDKCLGDDYMCDGTFGSQNWVVASTRSAGRYAMDVDAYALGNGCSAPVAESEVSRGTAIIGPAANENRR
jgi:hypothetical protein